MGVVKPFETYQYLAGEPMTARDKTEVGSRFWNKGKWDNFVARFLPENGDGQTFIDIGCNAGLFLKLAQDHGFSRIVGVDSNETAIRRGAKWRDKNGGKYGMMLSRMESCIDYLPVADYVVLANVHYYFKIEDWVKFLDRLRHKTRYCIIVTTKKRPGNRCWAQADILSVQEYFKEWTQADFVGTTDTTGDPRPRHLYGFLFESNSIQKLPINDLDSGNHVQDEFYAELDNGVDYKETKYYKIIRKYRLKDRKDWTEEKLERFFKDRLALYENIQAFGLKEPLLINSDNLILDGNHRYSMMKHLGFKEVFVRKV